MKIKILALSYLFPNPENPGYGIFVYNRLKEVAKSCEVKVISPLQWFPFANKLRRSASGKRIRCYEKHDNLDVFHPHFFSIPKFFKWFDSIVYFLAILPVVYYLKHKEKYDFDIVDVHWTYPDILAGYLISKIYRKKLIVTIRGKEALYPGEKGGRKFILDWCLKKADIVVNLSSELENLVQDIGVDADQTKVIFNGVDLDQFFYRDKAKARKSLGLPQDKKILLSVGSLILRKGHHDLIDAVASLNADFNLDLYIVGGINPEGNYSQELRALVAQYNLQNVHFVDAMSHEQLSQWYAAADLFCLATKGEGCPNVILEAMACGCPVIVSAVGAVPDLVKDGVDGLVVDLNSWNWQQRISEGLSFAWDRKKISQKMESMGWGCCADEVVATYRSVLGGTAEEIQKALKIIYHHRTLGDGAEGIHIREMIKAFRDLGHNVVVAGPVGEGVPEQNGSGGGLLSKIKALLPGFLFEICEIGYTFYSFVQLSWLIIKERPDFIYDRYIAFNAGGVLAAKLLRTPIFLEVNAPLALERSEQPDEKLYLKKIAFAIEKWVCAHADKTIVVSTPLKQYLLSIGVSESQLVVMPNGVNPEKFYPHEKDPVLMHKLSIEDDSIVIGFTGVLRAWHGLEMLLDSFRQISREYDNVFLLIVGGGPIRGELEKLINDYEIAEKVCITGRVPYVSVQNYVNLFDIAVSPKATFYASPMKVIEYMALGKPCVVPDTDNFLDMIDPGVDGVVFASGELEEVLKSLLEDRKLSREIGEKARLKVEIRLNWKWNAEKVCFFLLT